MFKELVAMWLRWSMLFVSVISDEVDNGEWWLKLESYHDVDESKKGNERWGRHWANVESVVVKATVQPSRRELLVLLQIFRNKRPVGVHEVWRIADECLTEADSAVHAGLAGYQFLLL